MTSVSLVVYATNKSNVQFYCITLLPLSGPALSALCRYSELRAFRKTISARKGFPPKLYFPTPDDLEKRRSQISKWLSSLLSSHAKEIEGFVRGQRAKYEEDDLEMAVTADDMPLYLSSSDSVRRYDPVNKNWPCVLTFNLFHVHLDMDSHLYAIGNCIWAPSFRGIQCYYPPWHQSVTIPYPENFLKSVSPQHGVTLDNQFVLYHHKQLVSLDIPSCSWSSFPPISSSVTTIRDSLWWPGFVAAGKHLHLIFPTEHFVFNAHTKSWKSLAPPPSTGTYYPGWVYAKKKIYMMVCSSHATQDSYCYDVRLDEWSQVAAFPTVHKVPTVVNIAYDGNNSIFVRSSSHIYCYDIAENAWEERKEMALSDRSMAIFFSNQFEERKEDGPSKEMAIFGNKMERLLIKSKLSGSGPWGELYQKNQITQVERDLMMTYEAATLSERLAIFKKMGSVNNVFQQLHEEEPSSEARERIEWLIFQALQEDPALGFVLCNVCPNKFKKTDKGTYTWAPPGSGHDADTPRTASRRKLLESKYYDDDDSGEEGAELTEVNEEELKETKVRGEKIMTQLKDKNIQVPEEFICPIIHNVMLEPVATVDGHAYERAAIETWFARGNDTSPLTNLKLDATHTIPNLPLRKLIRAFLDSHQVEMP